MPNITPHVFRHTFCTNMANKGMDIKTLQYVMGHSDVGVTLNVYTHASYDWAAEQIQKLSTLREAARKLSRENQVEIEQSYYTIYYTICP